MLPPHLSRFKYHELSMDGNMVNQEQGFFFEPAVPGYKACPLHVNREQAVVSHRVVSSARPEGRQPKLRARSSSIVDFISGHSELSAATACSDRVIMTLLTRVHRKAAQSTILRRRNSMEQCVQTAAQRVTDCTNAAAVVFSRDGGLFVHQVAKRILCSRGDQYLMWKASTSHQ